MPLLFTNQRRQVFSCRGPIYEDPFMYGFQIKASAFKFSYKSLSKKFFLVAFKRLQDFGLNFIYVWYDGRYIPRTPD